MTQYIVLFLIQVLCSKWSAEYLIQCFNTLQNNLERSEFEARTRLGAQVETLQREVNLLKKKLESEEKHHKSVINTWEVGEELAIIE